MSKRRGRRSSAARRGGSTQESAARATAVAAPAVETRSSAKEPDFASEYRYVLGDLRRIGVLAAGMFAILLVLALIIR